MTLKTVPKTFADGGRGSQGSWTFRMALILLLVALLAQPVDARAGSALQQADDPNPPDRLVKLVFIHHSTGENWLRDDYGGLGRALAENNYFVSDTNYGWGPDSIGDRTDIPNWTEWFASDATPVYMDALFTESGQNSGYTRMADDPGGENEIVLFKSCFPNSALEGSPDDPPDPDGWLTVGHAKYVYNGILRYFATRPDKLFIVITAPPLSDSSYADNARAFNNWLVEDWLAENGYTLPNVAVFDFYNVLTDRDAHTRFHDGRIERTIGDRNTLAYPSGDDHPSEAGSRKATEEFLPLLNVFYHRWAASAPSEPPAGETAPSLSPTITPGGQAATPDLIADFDTVMPSLAAYWDEATATQLTCASAGDESFGGSSALRIDFDVVAGSWSTCVLSFDSPQDWSGGEGLALALHASRAGIPYDVVIYAGSPEDRETYINSEETPQDSAGGWATFDIPWADFHRADWESGGGAPFDKPGEILEIAFGLNGLEAANNAGTIWVDEIHLSVAGASEEPAPAPSEGRGRGPCPGGLILPLLFVGLAWLLRRR